LPVECSGHATPGTSEQAADSRTPPGISVIDGGPQAGSQGCTQTRTRVKVGGLTRCGASREKTQAQQSQKYHLLSQAQAPKALFSVHDSSLPKGLIGAFDYLELPQGKTLRLLSFREKKIAVSKIRRLQKSIKGTPLEFEDSQQVQMGLQVVTGGQPGVFVCREGHPGGRSHLLVQGGVPDVQSRLRLQPE
jgi:hypothetical protein